MINDNKQCCSSLPVKQEYKPKGQFKEFLGYKSYTTGSLDAQKAVIIAFDIFKFSPQIQQVPFLGRLGADLLASQGLRVIMPDFFEGSEIDPACFGPEQTAEHAAEIQEFFAGPADPGASVGIMAQMVQNLKTDGAKKVIGVGFCWGAKLCVLSETLDAMALVHPALLTGEDAQNVDVPVCLLTSKDEDAKDMSAFTETVKLKPNADRSVFKHYPTSSHGWAAARADLSKEAERKAFQDAYLRLIEFISRAV